VDELAVFPLGIVVFPGMTVPLHVFEERYKRLVRHATSLEPPRFVIAPPPVEGIEDDGPARPGTVGTVLDVLDASENPDGTFQLLGHGRERCRLIHVREEAVPEPGGGERPLWFAEVEPWPLERGDPNEERVAAWDALEAFERYGDAFFAPQAREQAASAMPDDPLYQASFVCANLRLPSEGAQRLLEAPSLTERFRAAREAIDARLAAQGREHRRSSGTA
jgi:ATP-dependent Lon protease